MTESTCGPGHFQNFCGVTSSPPELTLIAAEGLGPLVPQTRKTKLRPMVRPTSNLSTVLAGQTFLSAIFTTRPATADQLKIPLSLSYTVRHNHNVVLLQKRWPQPNDFYYIESIHEESFSYHSYPV